MIKHECELKRFFIFNSTLGPKEGEEHKRILYYHPNDMNIEKQKNAVGLCEAIIKFMLTFSTDECEAFHTQKTREILYQAEPDYWMVMTVNVPYTQKTALDGTTYCEYQGEQVQTKVLRSVLASSHRMFRLFMGTFSEMPPQLLRQKLDSFFNPYISQVNVPHCDVLDVFQGVQYLPLNRLSFFNVQCFVNLVEANYPVIKHSVFLYNEQLIWNGISPADMQVVYKYLVLSLLPAHVEKELRGGPHVSAQHYGCFISPPGGLREPADLQRVSRVHLNYETGVQVFYMIVYRALAATMCFFIDGNTKLSLELVRSLDAFVGPQLTTIASNIADQGDKENSTNGSQAELSFPKYLYFNQLNLAYKSTVHKDNRRTGNIAVHPDILKLVADINGNRPSLEKYGEIFMKTINDFWVIGKVSNLREFYVIIQQKNSTLKDVNEEVKKICESKLKSIFFYPM